MRPLSTSARPVYSAGVLPAPPTAPSRSLRRSRGRRALRGTACVLVALAAAGCMRVGGDDEDRAPGVPDGQGGAIAGVDGGAGLERRTGAGADGPGGRKDERARPGEKGPSSSASPSAGGSAPGKAPGEPGAGGDGGDGHGPGQSGGPGRPAEPPTGDEPTPEPSGSSPEKPAEPTPPVPGGEPSPGPSAF